MTFYHSCSHEWEYSIIIAPTCVSKGEAIYKCLKCNKTNNVILDIDENAHDWDGGFVIKKATCGEEGEKICTCKLNHKHTIITKIARERHNLSDLVETIYPTFRSEGVKEHYVCLNCNNYVDLDKSTILSYSDLILERYDSTNLDNVENEIEDLSKCYDCLKIENNIEIRNIKIDIYYLTELEFSYLKKEVNKTMLMNYYDSFNLIVSRYNELFINL